MGCVCNSVLLEILLLLVGCVREEKNHKGPLNAYASGRVVGTLPIVCVFVSLFGFFVVFSLKLKNIWNFVDEYDISAVLLGCSIRCCLLLVI